LQIFTKEDYRCSKFQLCT